jgi:NAD(P)-dependent dehydrogenase (short-subunit alcohol dehydrogenase family)
MGLIGKIALVTGGTGELGKAVTKRYLEESAVVAVTYHNDADVPHFSKVFPSVLMLK